MKRGQHVILFLIPALLGAGIWMVSHDQAGLSNLRMKEIRNNPEKFYLTVSNSTCSYFFTYDPRAQDEWLFHGGVQFNTNQIPIIR